MATHNRPKFWVIFLSLEKFGVFWQNLMKIGEIWGKFTTTINTTTSTTKHQS